MNHLESIVNLNNVISPNFTDKIISFIDHKAKEDLTVKGGIVDTSMRKVTGYHLNFETPTNLFYWNFIKSEIQRLYIFYKAKFPRMASDKINQIDLLKYTPGGKYGVHIDQYTQAARHLSVIINLNNNYKGGDLVFADQKDSEIKRLKLIKGSVVFFPSNFMYPHGIEPVIKGTRYSIVAWLQ